MSSLSPGPIGQEVRVYDILSSTNGYALKELSKTTPREGTVIFAWFQSEGRGQIGRSWESEQGKNCCFSIILYPNIPARKQFYLNVAISLGILQGLESYLPGHLSLKWPNDIYYKNRKLGGILIQNTLRGEQIQHSVAGIGINVNQEVFPSDLPNPTSIRQITGMDMDPLVLLNDLCSAIDSMYARLRAARFDHMLEVYQTRLFGLGQTMKFIKRVGEETLEAKVSGVNPSGQLLLEKGNELLKFSFGELSLDLNSIL